MSRTTVYICNLLNTVQDCYTVRSKNLPGIYPHCWYSW